jgi:hypothetical protein
MENLLPMAEQVAEEIMPEIRINPEAFQKMCDTMINQMSNPISNIIKDIMNNSTANIKIDSNSETECNFATKDINIKFNKLLREESGFQKFLQEQLLEIRNQFPGLSDDQYRSILCAEWSPINKQKMIVLTEEIKNMTKEVENITNSFQNFYLEQLPEVQTKYPGLDLSLYKDMLRAKWSSANDRKIGELTTKIQNLTEEIKTLTK